MRTLSADLRHKPLCAWSPLSRLNIFTAPLLTTGALSVRGNERGPLDLAARGGEWSEEVVRGLESDAESFVAEVRTDPVAAEGGDLQVVAGLVVGLEKAAVPASEPTAGLRMDLRKGSGMARFDLSHRGNPLAVREPRPKPPGWWGPNPDHRHQVVFVKGKQPKRDGYFVEIDTVEPANNKLRTWRQPWQLGLNAPNIAIRESDKSATAITPGAALQILPIGEMTLRVIQGQEKPELLGWRIYDTTATPWPVPTYEWQADGTFCRAWIIQMQASESEWPVKSVQAHPTKHPGELRFTVHRRDGSTGHILRRFPAGGSADVTVISQDASGTTTAGLAMEGGVDSVAKPSAPRAQPDSR